MGVYGAVQGQGGREEAGLLPFADQRELQIQFALLLTEDLFQSRVLDPFDPGLVERPFEQRRVDGAGPVAPLGRLLIPGPLEASERLLGVRGRHRQEKVERLGDGAQGCVHFDDRSYECATAERVIVERTVNRFRPGELEGGPPECSIQLTGEGPLQEREFLSRARVPVDRRDLHSDITGCQLPGPPGRQQHGQARRGEQSPVLHAHFGFALQDLDTFQRRGQPFDGRRFGPRAVHHHPERRRRCMRNAFACSSGCPDLDDQEAAEHLREKLRDALDQPPRPAARSDSFRCDEIGGLPVDEPGDAGIDPGPGWSIHEQKRQLPVDVDSSTGRKRPANPLTAGEPVRDVPDQLVGQSGGSGGGHGCSPGWVVRECRDTDHRRFHSADGWYETGRPHEEA